MKFTETRTTYKLQLAIHEQTLNIQGRQLK